MKSKLEAYALVVCFAAVLGLILSAGVAGYSLFRIVAPEMTMHTIKYEKYQSNDSYLKSIGSCSATAKPEAPLTDDQVTEQRLKAYGVVVKSEKRSGFHLLILCAVGAFITGVTLLIHWKIAQKAKSKEVRRR